MFHQLRRIKKKYVFLNVGDILQDDDEVYFDLMWESIAPSYFGTSLLKSHGMVRREIKE